MTASADPDLSDADGLGAWSVSGYDWAALDRESRVTARTPDTNLVFRYVARTALRDGTLTLDLPRTDWPDDLVREPVGLDYTSAGGSVVVRPQAGWIEQPGDCRGAPSTWTVTPLADAQRVSIEHVDCEPGEQLVVRIWGIASPRQPGVYRFWAGVSQGTNGEGHLVSLRVQPRPSTQLSVRLPRRVQYDTPVAVTVKALRPDGRVDRSYRGGVALLSDGMNGCIFNGSYGSNVYDFTAADAGVKEITVQLYAVGYRIAARDVGREARPGLSNSFTIVDHPGYVPPCPISFH